jgi:hypothetical protein
VLFVISIFVIRDGRLQYCVMKNIAGFNNQSMALRRISPLDKPFLLRGEFFGELFALRGEFLGEPAGDPCSLLCLFSSASGDVASSSTGSA